MSLNFGRKEISLQDDTMIVTETDQNGIIIFASKDFCHFSEYTPQELIGKEHNLVRHPFMPKSVFEELWKTIQNGNLWNGIVVNKTKNGNYYWVNSTIYPSKRRDGSLKYISVRVKASKEEIEEAIKLYEKIQ